MAKDTIFVGVDNIARLMDAGWVGVDGVAREIDEIWVGDENGKALLVWNALSKVKAVLNGYSYAYAYSTPGGTGDDGIIYNSDTGKTTSLSFPSAISRDCVYYASSSGIFTCADTQSVTDGTSFTDKSNITSTDVYSISTRVVRKFNTDSTRVCYTLRYKKLADSAKYSLALVFWKLDKSTGMFVYEKDICIISDDLYGGSNVIDFCISDDFSTIACSWRSSSTEYKLGIFRGNPDSGYTAIDIYTTTTEWSAGEIHIDEECGEYVAQYSVIYYINGNTKTRLFSTDRIINRIRFNYDRSVMYLEEGGYSDGTLIICYSVNGPTVTEIGSFLDSGWVSIYDEDPNGQALYSYGSASGRSLIVTKLSKNSEGLITGHSKIKAVGTHNGYITAVTDHLTRFYSTEV